MLCGLGGGRLGGLFVAKFQFLQVAASSSVVISMYHRYHRRSPLILMAASAVMAMRGKLCVSFRVAPAAEFGQISPESGLLSANFLNEFLVGQTGLDDAHAYTVASRYLVRPREVRQEVRTIFHHVK